MIMKVTMIVGLLVLLAALVPTHQVVAVSPRPDIIVVMVDDLGAIDNRILDRLPNIKSLWLGSDALRFDNYYNETPLCCPGRASFLTGQHTRHHHVTRNAATLLDPSRTVATALHDAGYYTLLVGKYLNGAGRLSDKTPPGWDHVAMLATEIKDGSNPTKWYVDNSVVSAGYHDRYTLDKSVDYLQSADTDRPVFLWANPRAPHWGVNSSRPWLPAIETRYANDPRCEGITPWKPPSYSYAPKPSGFPLDGICRSMLTVDEMVGRLREVEAARGREALWVFTSDNGMAWGWHGFPIKNVPESGKTPLFFAGYGVSGGKTDALQSNIDLGPTLAEIGNATMPWADGESFGQLLSGAGAGRDWMLEDHPLGGNTRGPWRSGWKAIRTPEWYLLWRNDTARYYLFDLTNDPYMDKNVKSANTSTFRQLKTLFPW